MESVAYLTINYFGFSFVEFYDLFSDGLNKVRICFKDVLTACDYYEHGWEERVQDFRRSLDHIWDELYSNSLVRDRLFPQSRKEPISFWKGSFRDENPRKLFITFKFPFSSVEDAIYIPRHEALVVSLDLSAIMYLTYMAAGAFKKHR